MIWKIKRLTYGQLTLAQQLALFLTGNIICPVIFDLNKKKTQKKSYERPTLLCEMVLSAGKQFEVVLLLGGFIVQFQKLLASLGELFFSDSFPVPACCLSDHLCVQ